MSEPTHPEVAILNAALELPAGERAAYLEQACAGDAALRARVEELLYAHGHAGRFLEAPPAGLVFARPPPANMPLAEKPGDKIGRYKLLEQIGEGGCGVVYVAEQQEPVRRRVALKIIKLGMDTKQVIARFEAERQALALMDHPNIARVLDAGATETGRPFFVMELVRGVKITEYCDQNHLSARERLDLFIQVCRAVQHAHQKGVIHRDIKPSNILVTVNEGVPVPKVIDFGIAKATQGRLTDQTIYTAFEQFIGTPAYMSPEQAAMTSLDIDTRSDIYSLGVLLYELLTGKTPFDQKDLLAAGLDGMRRTIREIEPPKPSTRLTQDLVAMVGRVAPRAPWSGENRSSSGAHGVTRPTSQQIKETIHLVRGDLDWIVMKCLEKDRARRYETANGLARDIQRHLNCEPVVARPPSRWYEFQKTVRRHKVGFGATAAVFVCLLLALAGAIWGFLKEREARQAVEALRARDRALVERAQTTDRISKAKYLYGQFEREQAERLLDEIPPSALEPNSDHAILRRNLCWWHAAHEEWEQSASNFVTLARVDGKDNLDRITMDSLTRCVVLVQEGNTNGYDVLCHTILAKYSQTTEPWVAARVCRSCLLLPANERVLTRLDNLYRMMDSSKGDPRLGRDDPGWLLLAMALVDYRRGACSNAIADCQACIEPPYYFFGAHLRAPAARAILAMSYHRLHRDEEAIKALAEAREDDMENLSAVFSEQFVAPLYDGIYGQILTREAGALIEGHPGGENRSYTAGEYCLGDYYYRGLNGNKLTPNLLEAVKWYSKAMEHGSDQATNTLAWIMATCPDPRIRNGTNAVRLAEGLVAATHRQDGPSLATLAAAYAEAGQFQKAVSLQKEAIAKDTDETAEVKKIMRTCLERYESGEPWRE